MSPVICWCNGAVQIRTRSEDIAVFAPTSLTTLAVARLSNAFQLVLRSSLVQSWLVEMIEKNVKGPDAATRNASQTWVWGEAFLSIKAMQSVGTTSKPAPGDRA